MRQESHLPNEGFVCRFSSEVVSPPYASVGRLHPGCQIGRFCCFPAFAGRAASLLAGVFRPPSDRFRGRLLSSGRPFGILISGVCSVGRAAPAPLRIGRVGNKCSPQLGRSRTGEELGGHGLCPRFSSLPPPTRLSWQPRVIPSSPSRSAPPNATRREDKPFFLFLRPH